jgi:hypothetical protein
MGHYRCFEPPLVRPGQATHRYSRAPLPICSRTVLHRHVAVESRQKIQNSSLPLRSRRARRVLNSNTADLMLAQRASGETAFGCLHQPASMAAGLATRARLHPVPRRPRGTRPTCFLNQDRKGSFFLRVFAVMAQLSRASRSRYRPSRDRPGKKTKRRLPLPKSRFERTDDVARQGLDAQQRLRTARSGVCRGCPSRAKHVRTSL